MANLRGGQTLWDEASVAAGAKSPIAIPGPGQYVAIFVSNDDASVDGVVFAVEVSVTDSISPGRNAVLDSDPDGGLEWFPYEKAGGSALTITVAHGVKAMLDLSPFAPQYIRLRRTDSGGNAVVSAWVSAFGGE